MIKRTNQMKPKVETTKSVLTEINTNTMSTRKIQVNDKNKNAFNDYHKLSINNNTTNNNSNISSGIITKVSSDARLISEDDYNYKKNVGYYKKTHYFNNNTNNNNHHRHNHNYHQRYHRLQSDQQSHNQFTGKKSYRNGDDNINDCKKLVIKEDNLIPDKEISLVYKPVNEFNGDELMLEMSNLYNKLRIRLENQKQEFDNFNIDNDDKLVYDEKVSEENENEDEDKNKNKNKKKVLITNTTDLFGGWKPSNLDKKGMYNNNIGNQVNWDSFYGRKKSICGKNGVKNNNGNGRWHRTKYGPVPSEGIDLLVELNKKKNKK